MISTFQLEPALESYGACKFSHTFPMEKLFNYGALNLPTYVADTCS